MRFELFRIVSNCFEFQLTRWGTRDGSVLHITLAAHVRDVPLYNLLAALEALGQSLAADR